MSREIDDATDSLISRLTNSPEIGMITGTGLESLTQNIKVDFRIPYKEIPHFPISTVKGHKGTLVCGSLAGRIVLAMEGRFHLYQGYTPFEITFPIRVMSNLGIKYLFISSAAGSLNPGFMPGSLMIITDHINLTGMNPLIGPNMEEFGPRFPDMSRAYDPELIDLAIKKASEGNISLNQGVYIGITGPSLETPAETRFLRMIGADAVGMSTIFEVIVGVQCGLRVMAIVAITNLNLPDNMKKTSIEDVIMAANTAGPTLSDLWESILQDLPK
ncbi:MAG: purine-nucleoside phosphorylase [Thermodesulfovibrio sp. RBG_19FT_COMBO_42_12]|nr:MAG: purine-nucleoside phosphorylase [Thermodesulfovibrio sp. RBG_19FT_COMBO_42_12]